MTTKNEWWREAVIYQVYPRSFADSNGDGIGDLPGITSRLTALAELGVDAVWLSPFYPSPGEDAGYDVADYVDVDPTFGTLADFDDLLARAHELGIRVIVDLVPNHCSSAHRWFQEALATPSGSEKRKRFIFRPGRGVDGNEPPNNWESVFGGSAWTRSGDEWYLHLFDSSQPDFDWTNPWVRERFEEILRFWLDRGVDGFRVDVAHGLAKAEGLPDWLAPSEADSMGTGVGDVTPCPYFGLPAVHEIYSRWNEIVGEYDGDRVLCAEAWVEPLSTLANWVRPGQMHQVFNFAYLLADWSPTQLRGIIDDSLREMSHVGAPATWALSNHDVIRHASRLALTAPSPQGNGIGPDSAGLPDPEVGQRRARSATMLMLSLPGSAYLYQGEELGLPEVIDLPNESRQDPTWKRSNGSRYGRDGCRVPIPWEADAPAYGFNTTGAAWLPQPADWGNYARAGQEGQADSSLELYKAALKLRHELQLGRGTLTWKEAGDPEVLAFQNGDVTVLTNFGQEPVALPRGEVLLSSEPLGTELPGETTVWLREA